MRQISSWLPLQPLARHDGFGRRPGTIWLLRSTGLPVRSTGLPVSSTGPPVPIRIQRENVSCYVPIATMTLVSLLLTVPLHIVIRLLSR